MSVHIGGFLLTPESLRLLCVSAYGIQDHQIDPGDEFHWAILHFIDNDILECPNLVTYHGVDGNGVPTHKYVLVCRLAFVEDGLDVPDLSLDKTTMAYVNHWFPPWVRALDVFKNAKYVQYLYATGMVSVAIIRRKIEQYFSGADLKGRPCASLWLREEESEGRFHSYVPPPIPTSYVVPDDDDDDDPGDEIDSERKSLWPSI
ncbi:uncharacterized protein BXZ73DRAFT_109403 [Epithele typhae]|uniref:uncharacterized protein n=1 Tax=Epithele typhae TaxID=378194 RepID=UPI002008A3C7|nr:uncharacterized protein BXZ73DRAFT_109403 [Epithele typhae]KAH9910173.1 hypothetical protein BXZ73DRAFT_109403 [Epithele typhae]